MTSDTRRFLKSAAATIIIILVLVANIAFFKHLFKTNETQIISTTTEKKL
jgi:hypothetical protein